MSVFQNITVADTVLTDTLSCNQLITNSAISTTEYGGISTKTNSILPYSGNAISILGPLGGNLNTLNISSANVICNSNVAVQGNLITNGNCFLDFVNIASQTQVYNTPGASYIDFYSHSNIANVLPDLRIASLGGLSNIVGTGIAHINSRSLFMGSSVLAPSAGTGNLVVNYASANISGDLYTSGNMNVSGNINSTNLRISRLSSSAAGNVITYTGNALVLATQNSASFTSATSELLVNNNSRFRNTNITGYHWAAGNIFTHIAYGQGTRCWELSTDNFDNSTMYLSTNDGTTDSVFITYRRGVGMKIDPLSVNNQIFSDALFVNGTANIASNMVIAGNLNIGNINTVKDISLTGNLNMGAPNQRANINQLQFAIPYPNGNRGVYAFTALTGGSVASTGFLGFTTPVDDGSIAITSGAFFVPFNIATRKWLKVYISLRLSGAVNLTSAAYLEILTATSTAFTTATSLTRSHIGGSYGADLETISLMMPFELLSSQPYFKVRYTGNTSLPVQAGGAPTFASYIFIEEVLCQ